MSYFSIEIPCACPWGGAGEERQIIWGGAGSFDARRDAEAFAARFPARLPWRVMHHYWDDKEGRMVAAINGQHGDIPRLTTPAWIETAWGVTPPVWPERGAVGTVSLVYRP